MENCHLSLKTGLGIFDLVVIFTDFDDIDRKIKLERQALLEKSHTSLQAATLAEQVRGMTLPLFSIERQKLATEMFKQAIRIDPKYLGGYTGAASTLGTLAILSAEGTDKAAYLAEAKVMIAKAVDLNPTHAWTQASLAWISFANKEYDQALRVSKRAAYLAPLDGYILDTRGLILFFTRDFEGAAKVSDPAIRDSGSFVRAGYRNIFAAANFHLGSYEKVLKLFDEAGRRGDPVSPPGLAYQAAAKHALGDMAGARKVATELSGIWPQSHVDEVLLCFFKDPDHAHMVIDPLIEAGWDGE